MKRQHNLLEASDENPKRVQFYRKDKKLRVTIAVDRTTSVDRVATEQDLRDYDRYFQRSEQPETPVKAALDDAGVQPKKRGRPRKTD